MSAQGDPIWGTPDSGESGGTGEQPSPAWGTPDHGPGSTPVSSPQPGSAAGGLLTADLELMLGRVSEVEVVENATMFGDGGYDVLTLANERVAAFGADTSAAGMFFGNLASSRHPVQDGHGVLAAELIRNGSLFDMGSYAVLDRQNAQLATIYQENAFFSPRLMISVPSRGSLRMTGGSWGSNVFEVLDANDDSAVLATVQKRSNGFFSSTHTYRIGFAPNLPAVERFLVVVTTVCMDQVRDKD